jgi:SAM-dependent methyltransferase
LEPLPPLEILDYHTQADLLSRHLVALGRERQPLQILEAGCGRRWPLRLDGVRYTLTGVDLDEPGLEARKHQERDLDEAILGDLRTVELEGDRFDAIYSSYVLEHIDGAERVLDNFVRWLKDGGLILLMIPDRDSVWGFVTRITPFWFHVAFKRYAQRDPNAGKPGYAPFPTHHDRVVSRRGIREYCRTHGLTVKHEHARVFEPKRARLLIRAATKLIGWLSLGRLESRHSDVIFVLEKRPAA